MALSFFYLAQAYDPGKKQVKLDEDTSRHISQVLKMDPGSALYLTDGRGNLLTGTLLSVHKQGCIVDVLSASSQPKSKRKIAIGISLLKNMNRFEWFLEKATEIGISEIIPLICARSEKKQFRQQRLQTILQSAMLQSQQVWLPDLREPTHFSDTFLLSFAQKFIADPKQRDGVLLTDAVNPALDSQIILIGPEGGFEPEELQAALAAKFIPVCLGETRLRTETAGLVSASLLKMA